MPWGERRDYSGTCHNVSRFRETAVDELSGAFTNLFGFRGLCVISFDSLASASEQLALR